MKIRLVIFCVTMMVVSALMQPAFSADSGIKIGNATLHPYITLGVDYDDNVFLEPNNEKDDYIYVVSPGLGLTQPFGYKDRHLLQLFYKGDFGFYSDYSDQDYDNHTIKGAATFNMPKGFVKVGDLFKDTSDPADTEFTDRIDRKENKLDAVVNYKINNLEYELGYTNFMKTFDDSDFEGLEYDENIGTARVLYQIMPKTKALLEYNYGEIAYDNADGRDADYNQVRVGLKGEITGKTTGTVKVGYQSRDYDADAVDDYKNFVVELGILTVFSEYSDLSIYYLRTAEESTFLGNTHYEMDRISLKYKHRLTNRFTAIARLMYQVNQYPETVTVGTETKDRDDDYVTLGLGVQYDFVEWIRGELGYEYKERDSNFDTYDYDRNLVSLKVTFLL